MAVTYGLPVDTPDDLVKLTLRDPFLLLTYLS